MSAPVTVVVPACAGSGEVEHCVESVARHAEGGEVALELLVIDDPEDLGFARTVNRGLRQAAGDAVVLDAGTVVTPGWLDRLAAAASLLDVATVTPLTNSGSICTLPRSIVDAFGLHGPHPRIDECAAFVAEHSLGLLPEVITGVGLCTYVTRRALERCGLLDETTSAREGAEIDLCLRATRVGLRNLVEDSTFVYSRRGVSSGGYDRALEALHDRYRFALPAITRERAQDGLRTSFAALELGLHERRTDRPHVLHLLHSSPGIVGGTEKHLHSLMEALYDDFDFSVLYPVESGFGLRTFWNTGKGSPTTQEFLLPGAPKQVTKVHDEVAGAALTAALDMFDFDAVHIQNLIGHSLAPLEVLAGFPGSVVCSVRDLYLACPNFPLLYRRQEPCGIPEDLSFCNRCLPETRDLSLTYLEDFRSTVAARLETVDHWVFASRSAADYLLRAYDVDPARIEIIEHGATIHPDRVGRGLDEARICGEPLRLAFVGIGWARKGLAIVNELADAFAGSAVEIHHFGRLHQPASPEVHVHGPYDNELLPELLHRAGIGVVLLPGPYAETFGHVMTEALVAGLPVIGARYGALGERIRAQGAGWTIDPMDPRGIRELIERLDRARDELRRVTRRALDARPPAVGVTADRYAALYGTPSPRVTGPRPRGPGRASPRA